MIKFSKWMKAMAIVLILSMVLPGTATAQAAVKTASKNVPAGKKAALNVTEKILYLNGDNITGNKKSVALTILNKPADWEKAWNISFSTSEGKIAAVNKKGMVTAVKTGKASITCNITNKKTGKVLYQLECKVTVKENADKITLTNLPKENLMAIGVSQDFNRSLQAKSGGASTDLTEWVLTKNTAGAKVTSAGVVTAKKAGSFTLTARSYQSKAALKKYGKAAYTAVSRSVTVKVLEDRVITARDVINGKLALKDQAVGNLKIEKSVGDAEITLDKLHVAGALVLEDGANYTVIVNNSYINLTKSAAETGQTRLSFPMFGILKAQAAEIPAVPKLVIGNGSSVTIIAVTGGISIRQEGTARIGTIQVVSHSDKKLEVVLEGFTGELVVDALEGTETTITATECNITSATIGGDAGAKTISIQDTNAGTDKASNIAAVNIASSAQVVLDVKADYVAVKKEAAQAAVQINQPVTRVENNGTEVKLIVNSEVKELNSLGDKAEIQVAKEGKVETVTARGNDTSVKGEGTVTNAVVEGSNTKVDTAGTKVEVKPAATGVTVGGKEVTGGTAVVTQPGPTPTPTPSVPAAPSGPSGPGSDSEAREKAIYNAGKPLLDQAVELWTAVTPEQRTDIHYNGPEDKDKRAEQFYKAVLAMYNSKALNLPGEYAEGLQQASPAAIQMTYNILMHYRPYSFYSDAGTPDIGNYVDAKVKTYSKSNAALVMKACDLLVYFYGLFCNSTGELQKAGVIPAIDNVIETVMSARAEDFKEYYPNDPDRYYVDGHIRLDKLQEVRAALNSLIQTIDWSKFLDNSSGTTNLRSYYSGIIANDDYLYRTAYGIAWAALFNNPDQPNFVKVYRDNKPAGVSDYYRDYLVIRAIMSIIDEVGNSKIELDENVQKNAGVENALKKIGENIEVSQGGENEEELNVQLKAGADLQAVKTALKAVVAAQSFGEYDNYQVYEWNNELQEDELVKEGRYDKAELSRILDGEDYLENIIVSMGYRMNDDNADNSVYYLVNKLPMDNNPKYRLLEDSKWNILQCIMQEQYNVDTRSRRAVDRIIEGIKGSTGDDSRESFDTFIYEFNRTEEITANLEQVKNNEIYWRTLIYEIEQRINGSDTSDPLYRLGNGVDSSDRSYQEALDEIFNLMMTGKEKARATVFEALLNLAEKVKEGTREEGGGVVLSGTVGLDELRGSLQQVVDSFPLKGDDVYEPDNITVSGSAITAVSYDKGLIDSIIGNDYFTEDIINSIGDQIYVSESVPFYEITQAMPDNISDIPDYTYEAALWNVFGITMGGYIAKSGDSYESLGHLGEKIYSMTTLDEGTGDFILKEGTEVSGISDEIIGLTYQGASLIPGKNSREWSGSEVNREQLEGVLGDEAKLSALVPALREAMEEGSKSVSAFRPDTLQDFDVNNIWDYVGSVNEVLDYLHDAVID